jgi:hypothetical protein
VFEEIPQPTLTMPRGRGSSSRSTGTQGIVARQPIESRRLILENTFAIKEEFSNNEATSWAVRELKRRGLKRLFKPVAPTAYERLVRDFYENLRCECDRQDVLFSSIDGEEVQVTIADIAAALKCNHEPPESDIPWLECPPMLTVEDIVTDMCDGHFADDHRNAASKTKIPRNLLFIDMVLYRNVSFGAQDTEEGSVPQCIVCVPSQFLVLHPRDHMAADSEILGWSAPPGSRAHEDLGSAFSFSCHSHFEEERD